MEHPDYSTLFYHNPLPNWVFDRYSLQILDVNQAAIDHYGFSREEFLNMTIRDLRPPDDLPRLQIALEKVDDALGNILFGVFTHQKKNKERIQVEVHGHKVHYRDRSAVLVSCLDVTLKLKEQLFRDLIEKISNVFNSEVELRVSLDKLCQILLDVGNFSLVEIWLPDTGISKLKLVSKTITTEHARLFYSDSEQVVSLKLNEGLPGAVWGSHSSIIWDDVSSHPRFIRKNSAILAGIKTMIGIPLSHQGVKVGAILIGSDEQSTDIIRFGPTITKLETIIGSEIHRKRLENDLNHLFDTLPDVICLTDIGRKVIKMNHVGCQIFELSEDEMLGEPLEAFVHPEDQSYTLAEITKLNCENTLIKFENRIITKSGKIVWLNWHCKLAGEDDVLYIWAKDITAEKKLRQIADNASKIATVGGWEIDVMHNQLIWSDMVHQIYETNPEEYTPELSNAIEYYREDFRDMVTDVINEAMSTGKGIFFEAALITAKGNEVWVRAIGQTEMLNGKCVRLYGSFQDITQLKLAEMQVKTILNSISDAFYSVDKNWNFTFFNKEAENLLKKSSNAVLGNSIWEVFAPARGTILEEIYRRVAASGVPESFEYLYPGDNCWYEITTYPSDGGISSYFKNIDERIRSAKALEQAYSDKIKIIESIGDAFFTVDRNFIVTYWNNKAEELLGVSRDILVGNNLWEVFPDAVNLPSYRNYHKVLETGEMISFEDFYGKWLEVNAYPAEDGISVFFRDITYRKQYETELLELNKALEIRARDLEKSNEQLEQFAFITSHDLQEPLRMISSFLLQLEKKYGDKLDDKARQYIHFATDGAKRMKAIILDLLEYSRAGNMEGSDEEIDVNEIIDQFKFLRKRVIKDKSATIHANNLPKLYGHKVPLTQTFHSILDNALKYSKDGLPPEINIHIDEKKDVWVIRISDNGIGMDPQHFDKIFTIFQRLHNSDKYDGTGIGLSIAKKNVESWGGKIWVESQKGVGSAFNFTLNRNTL